jgi:outer membrane protein assembly factor BamB
MDRIDRRTVLAALVGLSGCTRISSPSGSSGSKNWQQRRGTAAKAGFTSSAPELREYPDVRWKLQRSEVASTPVVYGDSLVLTKSGSNTEGFLVRRSLDDGAKTWERHDGVLPDVRSATDGERAYYRTRSGAVVARGVEDGTERWRVDAPGDLLVDTVTIDGGTGVIPTTEGMRAVELATGSIRWRHRFDGGLSSESVSSVSGRVFGASSGTLHALDAGDGSELWQAEFDGSVVGTPVVERGRVFVGVDGESIHASVVGVDARSGSELWRTRIPGGGSGRTYSPDLAVGNGVLVAEYGENVHAFGTGSSETLWSITSAGSVQPPTVVGSTVYVGTRLGDRLLRAVDLESGERLWRHQFPSIVVEGDIAKGGVITEPVPFEGGLLVRAADALYAFEPDENG